MKILCMPTLNSTCVYYRFENFIKYWRKQGHEIAFAYWGPDFQQSCLWERDMTTKFISEVNDLVNSSELVIFQGVHTQKAVALILALQEAYKQPILAEYDDSPYSVNSSSPNFKHVGPGSKVELWGDEQIKKSDGVIVSTEYLKDVFASKNSKVFVVPNCIDFEIWDKLKSKKKKDKSIVKIGWEGGANQEINLRLIKKVIPKILDEFPNVVFHFKFGGYQIPYLNHERIIFEDFHSWVAIDKHPQALKDANFDIGVAPLRDLEFNRAKSNLRWLEYSALKIPTVASDVGPYRCIENGANGFLAREEEDWLDSLRKLIKDKALRVSMGKAAYREIRKNYNVERASKDYMERLSTFI